MTQRPASERCECIWNVEPNVIQVLGCKPYLSSVYLNLQPGHKVLLVARCFAVSEIKVMDLQGSDRIHLSGDRDEPHCGSI